MNIVFAHNVYNRYKTLKNTIDIERSYYNNSLISVAHNDKYVDLFSGYNNIKFIEFFEKTHKIGCVNGCILSIQNIINEDFDVLIFSHDDVSIHDINVVNNNINDIVNNKYDIICRKPLQYKDSVEIFGGYYMMEVVYFSKFAILDLFSNIKTFKNENDIPSLTGSISPEVWFYRLINKNNNLKINEIKFDIFSDYNSKLSEQMGYYHKNIGLRGWND